MKWRRSRVPHKKMGEEEKTVATIAAQLLQQRYERVVVHPLVLLSVVDHFTRVDDVRFFLFVFVLCTSARGYVLDAISR